MEVVTGKLPVRRIPPPPKTANTITIRIWNREGTEIREIVLDLDTLSPEHAAWIERKRAERGEVPKFSERLGR